MVLRMFDWFYLHMFLFIGWFVEKVNLFMKVYFDLLLCWALKVLVGCDFSDSLWTNLLFCWRGGRAWRYQLKYGLKNVAIFLAAQPRQMTGLNCSARWTLRPKGPFGWFLGVLPLNPLVNVVQFYLESRTTLNDGIIQDGVGDSLGWHVSCDWKRLAILRSPDITLSPSLWTNQLSLGCWRAVAFPKKS